MADVFDVVVDTRNRHEVAGRGLSDRGASLQTLEMPYLRIFADEDPLFFVTVPQHQPPPPFLGPCHITVPRDNAWHDADAFPRTSL